MELPDAIRRAALFPESDQPDAPAGHPSRRVRIEGVVLFMTDGSPLILASPEHVEAARVDHVVEAVRDVARTEGRKKVIWFVSRAASPAGLSERLLACGMRPNDEPGADALHAAMVCFEPPPPGPADVVARPAETPDEQLAAMMVGVDSFGMGDEMRRMIAGLAQRLWSYRGEPGTVEMFVALAEGEIVAFGGARFGRTTVHLSGGGTLAAHRGRGAYQALVRARWDAAVERGTPVLTVGAGAMSRPILERVGFSIVGWEDCLLDEIG
jgi:hypothetical protein